MIKNKGDNMKEIFKDIKGYEGLYQISNLGRVKSLERDIKLRQYTKHVDAFIMRQDLNKRGYLYIRLTKNGKQKAFRVHRLVAEAFIDNPNSLSQVNHIDFNRTNNNVNNLEWVTPQDNTNHSIEHLRASIKEYHKAKRGTYEQ